MRWPDGISNFLSQSMKVNSTAYAYIMDLKPLPLSFLNRISRERDRTCPSIPSPRLRNNNVYTEGRQTPLRGHLSTHPSLYFRSIGNAIDNPVCTNVSRLGLYGDIAGKERVAGKIERVGGVVVSGSENCWVERDCFGIFEKGLEQLIGKAVAAALRGA